MNLVKTLAKVAMGVMVARGVGKMISGRQGQPGGNGGLLGGGPTPPASGAGRGVGGIDGVGGLSKGNRGSGEFGSNPGGTRDGYGAESSNTSQSGGGGLGGLLESLTRGASAPQAGNSPPSGGGGGLADILGSVLGGASAGKTGGGLGDLLESLGGGRRAAERPVEQTPGRSPAATGSLGDLLNQAFGGKTAEPRPEQNTQAEIMLRGMLNAAKSDGRFDQAEQRKVLEHLGDVSAEERAFVESEMSKPLDVDAFVRSIPRGMEQQVYVMSLLGIELDSQAEARYLDQLARGLGIPPQQANAIHAQVGVPHLYG